MPTQRETAIMQSLLRKRKIL